MKKIKYTEEQLKAKIAESLKEQFQAGMLAGAKAISKVVWDKTCDATKTDAEIIKEIRDFCSVSLNISEKVKKKDE